MMMMMMMRDRPIVLVRMSTQINLRCVQSVHHQQACTRHWSMDGVNDTFFNAAPNVPQALAQ